VPKNFCEWYQKKNNRIYKKLLLLALKIIAILHNTLLVTFIKLLKNVSKGLIRNRSQNRCHTQAPDQGSTVDFFLFPRLKRIMKSASFADVAAIQERVTAVLRSIPNEAFAGSFQKLYERYQQCVVKDGGYFECQ
jgi:hypothetical protein